MTSLPSTKAAFAREVTDLPIPSLEDFPYSKVPLHFYIRRRADRKKTATPYLKTLAARYLASNLPDFITGPELPVDAERAI